MSKCLGELGNLSVVVKTTEEKDKLNETIKASQETLGLLTVYQNQ